MFLEKYLNETYLDLIYSNYNEDYIKNIILVDKIIDLALKYS